MYVNALIKYLVHLKKLIEKIENFKMDAVCNLTHVSQLPRRMKKVGVYIKVF